MLLHVLGHGFGKSVLFLGSGELARTEGTTAIAGVHGLLTRRPVIGAIFGIGLLGLLGLPPFALFASEITIAKAGFDQGLGWAIGAALLLVLVVFAAIAVHALRMLLGGSNVESGERGAPAERVAARVPLVLGLVVFAGLGISIWPIERLLHAAAAVVAG